MLNLESLREAIKWQKKGIEALPKDSNGEIDVGSKKYAEARLKLYQEHKPLRFKTSDSVDWQY